MTQRESKTISRTIGNNHEWGIAMITPMLNHFNSLKANYQSKGYAEKDASDKAMAETLVYTASFKRDAVRIIKSSYDYFKSFFTNESIMDFYNNCYGRSYPEKGYTSDIDAFRYSAFTAKELCLDGASVTASNLTESIKKQVWNWDWYSY